MWGGWGKERGKRGSAVAQERFHILETEKAALASRAATLEDALRARDAERAAMAAALHELRGNIRVIARMRPPSAREVAVGECVPHCCRPSRWPNRRARAHTQRRDQRARTRGRAGAHSGSARRGTKWRSASARHAAAPTLVHPVHPVHAYTNPVGARHAVRCLPPGRGRGRGSGVGGWGSGSGCTSSLQDEHAFQLDTVLDGGSR